MHNRGQAFSVPILILLVWMSTGGTNRMGDEAAAPVLNRRKDRAGHQAGSGAAQDHVLAHQPLRVLKELLLHLQILKDTLLGKQNKPR